MELRQGGRELDCKVAVHVMGYRWVTHLLQFSAEMQVKWLASPQELAESGGVYVPVKDEACRSLKLRAGFADSVPVYSGDLTAAAQIVTEMEKRGYSYTREDMGDRVRVSFCGPQGAGEGASAQTAAAIASGALAAVKQGLSSES